MWTQFFRRLDEARCSGPLAWALSAVMLALMAAALVGCAGLPAQAIDRAARVQDEAATVAEVALCRGMSIGAWMRRYGTSAERARAWQVLCEDGQHLPVGTAVEE